MAYEAAFAAVYFLFAVIFAVANVMTQDVQNRSNMFNAVNSIYNNVPFSTTPDQFLKDIMTPDDLYKWFKFAFVPATFMEQPVNGDSNGFCLDNMPCHIDEGDCDSSTQCQPDLSCRDLTTVSEGRLVNGLYWDAESLEQWCEYHGTPVNIHQSAQDCSILAGATSSGAGPCCYDPQTHGYIETIENISLLTSTTVFADVAVRANCPSNMASDLDCCTPLTPDPLTPNMTARRKEEDEGSGATTTVGNFNRLLYARITMKRYKIESNGRGFFRDISFLKIKGDGARIDSSQDNKEFEDKDAFIGMGGVNNEWKTDGTYAEAGGFSKTFPTHTGSDWSTFLEMLWLDRWFDERMGSFVLEVLYYNGNADTFMYLPFVFEFDFAGTCSKATKPLFINLNSDQMSGKYMAPRLMEKVLIGMVAGFVLFELHQMRTQGLNHYFAKPTKIVDMFSLALCTTVLLMNFLIFLDDTFVNFSFETLLNSTPVEAAELMNSLIKLMRLAQTQTYLVAVNLLMVFFRAVMLVTQLEGQLGLITNTLAAAMGRLCFFFFQYMLLLMGFVAFAFFTYGQYPYETEMTDLLMTFYIVFAMLVGHGNKDELLSAEPSLTTPIFLIIYYVVTVFVMQNMFVSILLSGYDQVFSDLEKKEAKYGKDRNFLVQIFVDYYKMIRTALRLIGKGFGLIWNNGLKYIIKGLASCFMEIVAACDCGCPNPLTVCLNCMRSCRRTKKEIEVTNEMLEHERDDAKKQLGKGDKFLQNVKGDPGAEQALKEKNKLVDDSLKKVDQWYKENPNVVPDEENMRTFYKELRSSRLALKDEIAEQRKKERPEELVIMFVFLSVFISMMVMLVTMGDVFNLQEANLAPVLDKYWLTPGTLKTTGYNEIQTFEDVGEWAFAAILALYQAMECRYYPLGTQATLNESERGLSNCNSAANYKQLVNSINKWNIGFLNTTFVRVTIQPACFVINEENRWAPGAPFLRSKLEDAACSGQACFQKALDSEGTCLNNAGEIMNVEDTYVKNSLGGNNPIPYNFSKEGFLGPYKLTGGFTISLGTSLKQCHDMLSYLKDDLWFSKNSVSIVFDWITYNGNVDYFSYNKVSFDLLSTGRLSSAYKTKGVPLNLTKGGNWYEFRRILCLVLFGIYGSMVIFFLTKVLRDLNRQRVRSHGAGQGGIKFVLVYYKSGWNIADTLSQICSIISMYNFIDYLINAFRAEFKFSTTNLEKYAVPNAAVQSFEMLKDTDPSRGLQDDWFIFHQFETLAQKYETFLDIAAINSFLIAVRVVKYVNASSYVKVYSGTLASGLGRQMYFLFVILLLLVGWALFFMIIFGNVDNKFASLDLSFSSLFMWILGTFDLSYMLAEQRIITIIFFVFYQILMNFVAINMFLATMLNTYSQTVGDNEIEREREKLKQDSETLYTEVEYKDKEAFKKDITAIDVDPDSREVYVRYRSKHGQAAQKNIVEGGREGGHQIVKVNGSREGWNQYDSTHDIYEIGIAEDPRDHMVRVIFKETTVEKKNACAEFLSNIFDAAQGGADDEGQDIKATVKGFWRKHGAVTQINMEMEKQVQNSRELNLDDGAEEADAGADAGDAKENPAFRKAVKIKVKKRLEDLLFSRAVTVPNQDDSVDPFDLADAHEPDAKPEEDGKEEDEMQIDDIRNQLLTEPVKGWEVWLDCLLSQIELEPEMEDECLVTEVLRTTEMQELHKSKARRKSQESVLQNFYKYASDVLSTLEFKAKKRYYEKLKIESQNRFKMFDEQNKVLHDYACELETEFTRIMENIHRYRAKKDVMIMKLSGLLDKESYKHLDTSSEPEDRSHMKRFSIPWPDSTQSVPGNRNETAL